MGKVILVGADPELFVRNEFGPVSAVGRFGGTKDKPLPVSKFGKGFAIQEDNVAVEYNIPPSASAASFEDANMKMLEHIKEVAKDQGLETHIVPSERFPDSELQTEAAQTFGCDPDFNAWELTMNPRPEAPDPNLRSCGGHIHIGADLNDMQKIFVCRWLDIYLGAPLTLYDTDDKRRLLYGRPGAMRFKPYGLEYRVLSNFWLTRPKFIPYMYQLIIAAVEEGRRARQIGTVLEEKVIEAFHGDKAAAKWLQVNYVGDMHGV